MPVDVKCEVCGKAQTVRPHRARTYRFCSYQCRSEWRKLHWTGASNPRWIEALREKVCGHCGVTFQCRPEESVTYFGKRKFCTKACADVGGFRYRGEANHKWRGGHSKRSANQKRWACSVISRDKATCQKCGAQGVELHAHHVNSFKDHPELRWDVANGETLCFQCHWQEHAALDANGVNSGKAAAGHAGGNPEPSPSRKVREGVTTRGRPYRRLEFSCEWCGKFVSRRLSDTKGKAHMFCGMSCASKFRMAVRNAKASTAVIPPRAPRAKAMI